MMTVRFKRYLCGFAIALAIFAAGCSTTPSPGPLSGSALYEDTFSSDLALWRIEAEGDAKITAHQGTLRVIAPGGATIWFAPELTAPIEIRYTITAVDEGWPHDRVSDLNQFWMARPPAGADLFGAGHNRTGKFADYDALELYYVGVGGHDNTRTRFRRYIGQPGNRPLSAEHDLSGKEFLIEANREYRMRIVSEGHRQRFYRDGKLVFDVADPQPYLSGRFGFRTVRNHMIIKDFIVRSLP